MGEGFILEKISGDGVTFIHAGGDLFHFDLQPSETILIDTGSVVAWDESVTYDVQTVGSIRCSSSKPVNLGSLYKSLWSF
jgi:uncharacterized protein (AIM24 family)